MSYFKSIKQIEEPVKIAELLDLLIRTLLNSPLVRTAITSTGLLQIAGLPYTTNISSSYGVNVPTGGPPTVGGGSWAWVWIGPVDQRWEIIQRSNIEYNECQRSKFTFTTGA